MSKEIPCPKCGHVWLWVDWKKEEDAVCPKGHGCARHQEEKMTDDLIAMVRLAQRDERMSIGALYGDLADRIEELETKLQAVVEDKIDVVVELTKLQTHLEDFFALLEITEQKDDGRYFHPTIIRSSRALDAEKLDKILAELKRSITANDKSNA